MAFESILPGNTRRSYHPLAAEPLTVSRHRSKSPRGTHDTRPYLAFRFLRSLILQLGWYPRLTLDVQVDASTGIARVVPVYPGRTLNPTTNCSGSCVLTFPLQPDWVQFFDISGQVALVHRVCRQQPRQQWLATLEFECPTPARAKQLGLEQQEQGAVVEVGE